MGFFDKIFKKKDIKNNDKQGKMEKKTEIKGLIPKVESQKFSTLKPKADLSKQEGQQEVKVKRISKREDTKSAYKVLIKPLITEKATNLVSLNKYVFKVAKDANKIEIKKAIKALYGLEPVSINIINERGKKIIYGRIRGKKTNWKKAIITLKSGEKLDIYEGV